jgi:hypothetical protein
LTAEIAEAAEIFLYFLCVLRVLCGGILGDRRSGMCYAARKLQTVN